MLWLILLGLIYVIVAIVDSIKKKGAEEARRNEYEWAQQQERIRKIKEENEYKKAMDEMMSYAAAPSVLPSELPNSVDEFVAWKRNHPGKSIVDYCKDNDEKLKSEALKELYEYSKSPNAIQEALPDKADDYVNWRLLHRESSIHEYVAGRLQQIGNIKIMEAYKNAAEQSEEQRWE